MTIHCNTWHIDNNNSFLFIWIMVMVFQVHRGVFYKYLVATLGTMVIKQDRNVFIKERERYCHFQRVFWFLNRLLAKQVSCP